MNLKETNHNTAAIPARCRPLTMSRSWAEAIGTPAVAHRGHTFANKSLQTEVLAGTAIAGSRAPPLFYRPPLSATTITPGTIKTMVAMVRQVMVSRPK